MDRLWLEDGCTLLEEFMDVSEPLGSLLERRRFGSPVFTPASVGSARAITVWSVSLVVPVEYGGNLGVGGIWYRCL